MNNNDLSGSDVLGVAKFYKSTNRLSAREFENSKSISFIDKSTGSIQQELAFHHENCPLCDSQIAFQIFNKDGYVHLKCSACDFIFVNPCLKPQIILEQVYGETEYPFFESVNSEQQRMFDRKRFTGTLDYIQNRFPRKKSIIDLGCGSGFFLKICEERGFSELFGVDALKKAVKYAHNEFNLNNVLFGDYSEVNIIEKKFDVVSMWELLDHVVEPLELLQIAIDLLKPAGLLVISVRNGDSLAARILQEKCNMFLGYAHTNFWNSQSFDLIAEKYDLTILNIETYISELGAVNNYLNYENPYSATSRQLEFLPDANYILKNMLGYKFITILQKK